MPTYEYACKTCGGHLEVVQSFHDSPLTQCPACGGPLRKVFGNIGITFKGSGFYRTDNRSNGHRNGAGAKASEAKGAEAKPGDGASSSNGGGQAKDASTTKAAVTSAAS